MTGGEFTRRGFIEIAGASIGALSLGGGSVQPQVGEPDDNGEGVDHHALLLGPEGKRPEVGGEYLSQWDTYHFAYFATDTGVKSYIETDDTQWTELPMPNPETQVDELRVEDHTSFFNHTFARPNAPDDKNWDYASADVTKQNSEIELASTATLESQQRGNYPTGSEAIPGVAWRVTGTPTAGRADAGYFTSSEGFGVGEDSTDSYVFIRKGGTTERIYRSDWNGHVPDSRVWHADRPVITRFPHLFYGGGSIEVRALLHEDNESRLETLHTFTPENLPSGISSGPPINQPNLPVTFESSSLSGGSLRANAAHYEYGEMRGENRVNGEHFTDVSVGTSSWTPLISWRKRSNWEMVNVKPLTITAFAESNDVKLALQLDTTLSSTSFSRPQNTADDETAVEVDTAGSIDSTGQRRWVGFAKAGQGNKVSSSESEKLDFNLPANQTVTLVAQAVGSGATVDGSIKWEEFF